MTCQARTEGDEMVCRACGLRWDRSDPEPPVCGKQVQVPPPSIVPFQSGLPADIR